MFELKGKVVIVTGAGSGIGRGISEVLAGHQARIAVVDRNKAGMQETCSELEKLGAESEAITCDVGDEEQVQAMAESVRKRFGRIDGLVNNAGVYFAKPFEQITAEEWDHVIGVDLRGTFLCTRACIGDFLRQGSGSVVNVSSVHSVACVPDASPYDAAKWGVVGMTKALAVEYASRGIRFNCLSPGLIDTQIWRDIQATTEDLEACLAHWRANIPMGRVGLPREMGNVAAFLLSDMASYVTGCNLNADGGMISQLVSKE